MNSKGNSLIVGVDYATTEIISLRPEEDSNSRHQEKRLLPTLGEIWIVLASAVILFPILIFAVTSVALNSVTLSATLGQLLSSDILARFSELVVKIAPYSYGLLPLLILFNKKIFSKPPTHLLICDEGLAVFNHSSDGILNTISPKNITAIDYGKIFYSANSSDALIGLGQTYGLLCKVSWMYLDYVFVEKSKLFQSSSFLCFRSTSGPIAKVRIDEFFSFDAKSRLLYALKYLAPQAQCDKEVYELLSENVESSYTELWYAALTAAPEREKLTMLESETIVCDRYRILRRIGQGGQGSAYLATSLESNKSVVLKEYILPIHVSIESKKQAIERLENEVVLLEKLDHPKIIKVLDFLINDQRAYIVLEKAEGENLRNLVLQYGPMPEELIRNLLQDFCDVLDYLHNQNPCIVHQDFTPDNLVYHPESGLKLIDFNIAQKVSDNGSLLASGKRAYMAPEQVRGFCSTQSDIYALGATLFFLLFGQDPEPLETFKPKSISGAASQELEQIISLCTELELDKRYKSVSQIKLHCRNWRH